VQDLGSQTLRLNHCYCSKQYIIHIYCFLTNYMLQCVVGLRSNDVLLHQPLEKVEPTHVDDEPFELTEEIEAQIIGNILPDDDDLLSGVDVGYTAHASNGDDVDDDIFYTGGGMELETVENKKSTEPNSGANDGLGSLNGTMNGQHPYGEHPSRTLFVRNINSNVEDSELKVLFEVCSFFLFSA
jgi:hypothetical protein